MGAEQNQDQGDTEMLTDRSAWESVPACTDIWNWCLPRPFFSAGPKTANW